MNANPSVLQRQLTDLIRRVRIMERSLADYEAVTGVNLSAEETVVPLLSITPVVTGSTTTFVLTFPSAPGEQFQVQVSQMLPYWEDLDSPIAAAADPAVSTTWTSGPYTIDDMPVYFRVRKFPELVAMCPPAVPCACPA